MLPLLLLPLLWVLLLLLRLSITYICFLFDHHLVRNISQVLCTVFLSSCCFMFGDKKHCQRLRTVLHWLDHRIRHKFVFFHYSVVWRKALELIVWAERRFFKCMIDCTGQVTGSANDSWSSLQILKVFCGGLRSLGLAHLLFWGNWLAWGRLTQWETSYVALRVPAEMIQEYDDLVQRTQVPSGLLLWL